MKSDQSLLKNTFFLTSKVVLSIGIAFFSSRLLLKALGVSDFGLYNIIAGFVLILSSLRAFFSSSIQRFINVAKGDNDSERMKAVFNLGIVLHAIIALVFILLAETFGLWYLNNELVIDDTRIGAANYVYQFSIVMGVLYVLFVPFDALIIAHERLKFYALNTTAELIVKLLIIIYVSSSNDDVLILYAFLLMLSTIFFRCNIILFCLRKLKNYRITLYWNKTLFGELASFSGWTFLGHITHIICHEGTNIVLNLFGGTLLNAPRALAYQIMNAFNQFAANLSLIVSPRVMTNYASKKEKSIRLLFFATKSVFYLLFAMAVPLIFFLENYLELWLDQIPEYTSEFTILIISYLLIKIFTNAINTLFLADGNLNWSYLTQSIFSVLVVFVSFLALKLGYSYGSVFLVLTVTEVIKIGVLLTIVKSQLQISIIFVVRYLLFEPCIIATVTFVIYYSCNAIFTSLNGILNVILFSGLIFLILIAISFIFGVTKDERQIIKENIINKITLKNH